MYQLTDDTRDSYTNKAVMIDCIVRTSISLNILFVEMGQIHVAGLYIIVLQKIR